MSWSREQVTLLIDEFKNYPCLYAVKSKMYTNKHARQCALEKITNVVKELKPGITINEVKAKFAGLRATFLTENKKHHDSMKSGAGEDEIYYPSLWYFDNMKFILDHIETRQSLDSINLENETNTILEYDREEFEKDACISEENSQIYIINDSGDVMEFPDNRPSSRSSSSLGYSQTPPRHGGSYSENQQLSKRKKSRQETTDDTVMQEASNTLRALSATLSNKNHSEQAIDPDVALGNFVVAKYKQIECIDVRLEVEEKIAKVLFDGIKKSRNLSNNM